MANTAEVINFPVPDVAPKEPRVADLDDGYTRIANELLEAVMLAGLSQHQLLVLMAVMRKTYGFNKKADWVSNDQLSALTGLAATRCSTAKNELIRKSVLTQSGRHVGINKMISEWQISKPERRREYGATKNKAGYIYVFAESECGPVKIGFTTRKSEERLKEVRHYFDGKNPKVFFVSPFSLHAGAMEPVIHENLKAQMIRGEMFDIQVSQAIENISAVMETFQPSGKESFTPCGNDIFSQGGNTKDKHTKDNKDNINNPPKSPRAVSFDASAVQLPDWLSAEIWSSWVAYRRDLKKPIKSQQTVTQAINLLDRCRLNGYSPDEIINQSIANGWQGLFEPKGARPQRRQESRVTERFADKDYGKTEIPDWMRDQQ